MHIVLVSNCEQAALSRTRSLLDRYASRIAERTWATLITQEALDELSRALRRIASRHTSVACYRSDAVVGLRLIWVVGNRQAYDVHGRFAVATEAHKRPLALPYRHAALVARLAGYVHDLGKASKYFQSKLKTSRLRTGKERAQRDPIRHEWLSAWLFRDLMTSHSEGTLSPELLENAWGKMLASEGDHEHGPVANYALPVAQVMGSALDAVGWAVCTHHGAMGGALDQPHGVNGDKHLHLSNRSPLSNLTLAHPGAFAARGAPQDAARWTELFCEIEKVARRLRALERPVRSWEGVMLLARAALILADHAVSAGTFEGLREDGILYANTKLEPDAEPSSHSLRRGKRTGLARRCDQPLSWHLRSVGECAASNVRMLAGEDLPKVDRELVRALLEHRSEPHGPFAWQDRAADFVAEAQGGKLVFDVASTGAGKTLANLKMAFAMRPAQTRIAVAFNLRSLTQQTFRAFRKAVKQDDPTGFERDFACLLGERGTIEMDFSKDDEDDRPMQDVIELEGAQRLAVPEWLSKIARRSGESGARASERLAKLIAVPVLVCTMDWIVASAEPGEQDRHAKALIRVANSDLILDEVDSYDAKATVAVMRVVQMAAAFGRNVIVSSATLNPVLADGLCRAYASGRATYEAMFGCEPWHLVIVGERFEPQLRSNPSAEEAASFYRDTMCCMARKLAGRDVPVLRRATIAAVEEKAKFNEVIAREARALHDMNASVPAGLSCRLSIGLVRVAQVATCMEVAEALRESGDFVVTVYHARDVQQRRAERERWLDCILDRNTSAWIDALRKAFPQIEQMSGEVRLVVVATPLEEVGRDHDFDWAVIEPSSMHSIVQVAGRVNRHRREHLAPGRINVSILSRNLRALEGEKCAFVRPGLETEAENGTQTTHPSHDMHELLKTVAGEQTDGILDARLLFDAGGRKAMMACYDEEAVRIQISHAEPIIARRSGFESHFMLAAFACKYPLRDAPAQKVYQLDLLHEQFRAQFNKGSSNNEKSCGKVVCQPIPSDNVWLTPDLHDDRFSQEELLFSANHDKPISKIEIVWNGVKVE
jgi:CRISPR-associated endonuclease/helicase Cas3